MPYGYYTLVRLIAMFSFILFALNENKKVNSQTTMLVFVFLAVLFQPIFKIPLGRTIWNIVDVLVAVFLLINVLRDYRKSDKNIKTL
jgi:uncharacterized membrane protein YccC